MTDPNAKDLSPTLRTAITLLEAGQPDQAVSSANFHADKTLRLHGDSPQLLDSLNEFGWVLWWAGEQDRAIEKFRQATALALSISPLENYVRLVVQLGLLIAQTGKIEQARNELLQCSSFEIQSEDQCRLFYHLAEFSLYLGDIDASLQHIVKAISLNDLSRKLSFWRSIALHAEILKTKSPDNKSFDTVKNPSADALEELVSAVISRAPESDPVILLEVMEELRSVLDLSPSATLVQKLRLDSEIANLLGNLERHSDRIQIISSQIQYFESATPLDRIQLQLAIALAYAESFELQKAADLYLQSIKELGALNDPELSFQAMFQFSMLLDQQTKHPEAIHWLRLASEEAFKTDDFVGVLRAKGITGIVYLHQGKSDQALPYLREALERLAPGDPYASKVMKHWESFQAGQPCNCFNSLEISKQKVRKQILCNSPRGFLRDVKLTIENDIWKVDFDFARFPKPEILRLIQTISQAAKEFHLG